MSGGYPSGDDVLSNELWASWEFELSQGRLFAPWRSALLNPGEFQTWRASGKTEDIAALVTRPTVSLFEAVVLIGWRILGDPAVLIPGTPYLFYRAITDGEIDPREPVTLIRNSDDPPGPTIPDLTWRLYPGELQAFAVKRWGLGVYTEAELNGVHGLGSEATPRYGPAHQEGAPNSPRKPGRPYGPTDPVIKEAWAWCRNELNRDPQANKAELARQAIKRFAPEEWNDGKRRQASETLRDWLKPSKAPDRD